jgi:hypothetical protein
VVCLHIHREGNTDISTYAFKTNVDTFSALKVNGLQAKIVQLIKTTVTPIYATIQLANNQSVTRPMVRDILIIANC